MHSLSNSPAAWLAVAVAATSSGEVELRDEARAGQIWRVDFERNLVVELDRCTLGTGPIIHCAGMPRREEQRRDSWTDEYREVEDGELRELRRTYTRIARNLRTKWAASPNWNQRDSGSSSSSATSALVDKVVVFVWDAEREEFEVRPEPHDYIDPDLLEPLRADARPRNLLPDRSVEVGDVWLVGADTLRELFEPGGSIAFDSSATDLFDELFASGTLEATTDQLRVRLEEIDEQQAEVLARIVFEGRVELEPSSEQLSELSLLGYPVAGTGTRTTSIELECEGELVWDLRARHWRSVVCVATFALDIELEFFATGSRTELATTDRSRGELRIDARCEPATR